MIELVDTSALILAARRPDVGGQFGDLLATDGVAVCELIMLEYLNGARNAHEYVRFERGLRAARVVRTSAAEWDRALEVHRELARTGPGHQRRVRIADLIIARGGRTKRLADRPLRQGL